LGIRKSLVTARYRQTGYTAASAAAASAYIANASNGDCGRLQGSL
jgi:hypothetical protein